MYVLMSFNEHEEIGKFEVLVSQIRDIKFEEIDMATRMLKVSSSFIDTVLGLIENNPEMNDKEIAEILVDLEN